MKPAAKPDDLTVDTIASALNAISPDLSRHEWARIGMALKSELGDREGFDLFDQWSREGQGYDAKNCRDTWKSIRADGGVNIGTLIYQAQANGWQFTDDRTHLTAEAIEARRAAREAERKAAERERKRLQGEAAKVANLAWQNAKSADDGHPYLVGKGVHAYGLGVGSWPLIGESGEPWKYIPGALLVPIMDAHNGNRISLQGILVEPGGRVQKRYLKNGRKRGGCHMIGTPPAAGQILAFCEGYATGATIHGLTKWPVVVTFDAPNLVVVAEAMRSQFPYASFVICADNDEWSKAGDIENPGLHFAKRAAEATRGFVIAPQFRDKAGEPTDFNDLALREGAHVARGQLLNNLLSRRGAESAGEFPANDYSDAANDNQRDEARRRRQKDENALIQDDAPCTTPPMMTVEDMLADCVWIASGSQVGRLSAPRSVLSFQEFCDLTACSTTELCEPGSRARPRTVGNAVLWKREPERKTVTARTFHAGAGKICRDPDGEAALNSWRPTARRTSSADVQPFLDHVAYLIADQAEREVFLDWLAHIEQCPGVLPHYGWLHIAANTGTGRNWLASALARVWRGYVAPNVDLPALLESQFNGSLAGRILAMVDEVQEGGGENPFRHANRLKSLVNAEERTINPKFGRQYREHNACRWLVFSNHENALPLNDNDRRWRVVRHDAAPRSAQDYAKLYGLLTDAEFINSLGAYLGSRNIATFNPGERPPMNDAKRAAVAASKTLVQQGTEQLIQGWPADVITNPDAADILGEGQDRGFTPAMRRAMNEAGAVQYGNGRLVKVRGHPAKCWVLRNAVKWADAPPSALGAEAARARGCDSTRPAIDVLAGAGADPPDQERPF